MKTSMAAFVAFLSLYAMEGVKSEGHEGCSVPGTMTCYPTSTPPTFDGDLSDWSDVQGGVTTMIRDIWGKMYDSEAVYKCSYDSEKIYFALEIPGLYRFDELDNKKCAAIGTMMKIGEKASYLNMGGCPESMELGCADGIPDSCADYLVDLGAHWELRTTQAGVEYPMNATTGSGNDLIANNDDEYGSSPYCRPDDDDELAGNEWSGAWAHSNPVEGEDGVYTFELSRLLQTPSLATDAQFTAGETYDFGIAYWDPFETEFGWTAAGHYLTGCSADWINLTLSTDAAVAPVEDVVTCEAPGELVCNYVDDAAVPTLDGDLMDWDAVEGGITTELRSMFGMSYALGEPTYKCVHDGEKIYFSMEIPGEYRFSADDDKKCAAIGTMMPIGSMAGYINMGGCPETMANGCADGIPDTCADYMVDLGAHWELKTTEMGVEYPMNPSTGSGNDLIANNDDEYGSSSFCRPDDDDANAGNEWAGAWSHSNPVEGEMGMYKFEIARTLTTPSSVTDAQMAVGETYKFGIAFWDPYETVDGWTAAGHFVTGCSAEWIHLTIKEGGDTGGTEAPDSEDPDGESGAFGRSMYLGLASTALALVW